MTHKGFVLAVTTLLRVTVAQTPVKREDLKCSISGVVTDPDSKPLQSRIIAYEIVVRNGWEIPFARCSANTDRDGKFSCGRIPAGHYLVAAYSAKAMPGENSEKDQSNDHPENPKWIYPLTFYPNTTTIDNASIIRLRSGENGSATMVITPARAKTLSITLPVNTPKAAVSVAVQSSDFNLNLREPIRHDRDRGKFVVDTISEGQYFVTGNWFTDGADHHGSLTLHVPSKSDLNVALQESTTAKVAGRIHFDTLPDDGTKVRLALYPRSGGESKKTYISEVARDGTFNFGTVEPGDYYTGLVNGGSWYVRSVSNYGKVYPSGILSVTESSSSAILDVEVSAKAASLSGSLHEKGSESGAGLVVIASAMLGVVTTVAADDRGRFAVTGLMPGDYRLFAFPAGSDVPYRNPQMQKIISEHGTEISVDEGQQVTSVSVEMIRDTGFLTW